MQSQHLLNLGVRIPATRRVKNAEPTTLRPHGTSLPAFSLRLLTRRRVKHNRGVGQSSRIQSLLQHRDQPLPRSLQIPRSMATTTQTRCMQQVVAIDNQVNPRHPLPAPSATILRDHVHVVNPPSFATSPSVTMLNASAPLRYSLGTRGAISAFHRFSINP